MEEEIIFSVKNGIARIRINRAEKSNSFSSLMFEKTIKMCDALQWEVPEDVSISVIEGMGEFFSTGFDFDEIVELSNSSKERIFEEALKQAKLLRQIASLPFPVIAKVRGGALNLGLGLLAVCDYVIAEKDAIFGMPLIKMGIPPAMTSLYILRKCGLLAASHMALSGELFGCKEALSMNIISRCFPKEKFEEEAKKIEEDFLECEPNALRKAKKLLLKASPVPQSEKEEYAAMQFSEALSSKEVKEGILAFKEKRTPLWVYKQER